MIQALARERIHYEKIKYRILINAKFYDGTE